MRYDRRELFVNKSNIYKKYFEDRGAKRVVQYTTPIIPQPTVLDEQSLNSVPYIWKLGDRYPKLADKFYHDPNLWWILAWYNQMPTEYHIIPGVTIWAPMPLERVLFIFGA